MIDNWEVAYHVNVSILHMYIHISVINQCQYYVCVCIFVYISGSTFMYISIMGWMCIYFYV